MYTDNNAITQATKKGQTIPPTREKQTTILTKEGEQALLQRDGIHPLNIRVVTTIHKRVHKEELPNFRMLADAQMKDHKVHAEGYDNSFVKKN